MNTSNIFDATPEEFDVRMVDMIGNFLSQTYDHIFADAVVARMLGAYVSAMYKTHEVYTAAKGKHPCASPKKGKELPLVTEERDEVTLNKELPCLIRYAPDAYHPPLIEMWSPPKKHLGAPRMPYNSPVRFSRNSDRHNFRGKVAVKELMTPCGTLILYNSPPLQPEITEDNSASDILHEAMVVLKELPVTKCRRVGCDKQRYKKRMCKYHFYSYLKKNPFC